MCVSVNYDINIMKLRNVVICTLKLIYKPLACKYYISPNCSTKNFTVIFSGTNLLIWTPIYT